VIALLGATGYTGKLVAAELSKKGVPHRLGGRNPEKLAALPSDAERFVLDVDEGARLDAFLDGASAIISTVGPFIRLGMPAVEAAARNGVPYVDSTGEQEFMADVYAKFADAPAPIVPACAFDYVPGDLTAAASPGIARIGPALAQRWRQIRFILGFTQSWKRSTVDEREHAFAKSVGRERAIAIEDGAIEVFAEGDLAALE
jgi:short subunit dehydrogenase-like uncharacterized protein